MVGILIKACLPNNPTSRGDLLIMGFLGFSPFEISLMNLHFHYGKKPEGGANYLKVANEIVCYHQAELIQYILLAGDFHKSIQNQLAVSVHSMSDIKKRVDNLIHHLSDKFNQALKQTYHYLDEYYGLRSKLPARICVKGADNGRIIAIDRNEPVGYDNEADCEVADNCGFHTVVKTGKRYICNSIYKAFVNGDYRNPRLVPDAVARYTPPSKRESKASKKNYGYVKDKSWKRCWRPISNTTPPIYPRQRDCYKSTLIVPMTLWGHRTTLTRRFLEMLGLKQDNRPGRFIFGFLCFDHMDDGFFNDEADTMLGYIAADLLSLYLITRLNYTENSIVFNEAQRCLHKYQNENEKNTAQHAATSNA